MAPKSSTSRIPTSKLLNSNIVEMNPTENKLSWARRSTRAKYQKKLKNRLSTRRGRAKTPQNSPVANTFGINTSSVSTVYPYIHKYSPEANTFGTNARSIIANASNTPKKSPVANRETPPRSILKKPTLRSILKNPTLRSILKNPLPKPPKSPKSIQFANRQKMSIRRRR